MITIFLEERDAYFHYIPTTSSLSSLLHTVLPPKSRIIIALSILNNKFHPKSTLLHYVILLLFLVIIIIIIIIIVIPIVFIIMHVLKFACEWIDDPI